MKRRPIAWRLLAVLIVITALTECSIVTAIIDAAQKKPSVDTEIHRDWGRAMSDASIETKALIEIRKADHRLLDARITIASFNGITLLVGQTPSPSLGRLAQQILQDTPGVRTVHNKLTYTRARDFPLRSDDAWISTSIRSRLQFSTRVNLSEVKIITDSATVYILGLLDRKSADIVIDTARNTSGVQRVVPLFETIPAPKP